MSDVPRWKLLSAGCDHDMCTDCWRGHLSARLAEFGKDVHFLGGCPDPGCGAIIPESVWLEMANDHDRTVYTQHVIHSYIPLTGQVRVPCLSLARCATHCCVVSIWRNVFVSSRRLRTLLVVRACSHLFPRPLMFPSLPAPAGGVVSQPQVHACPALPQRAL
jgi:hypothetical protein